jgi:hypothetical protein
VYTDPNDLRAQHIALVRLDDEINKAMNKCTALNGGIIKSKSISLREVRTQGGRIEWIAFRNVSIRCVGSADIDDDGVNK